jgi:phosphoglycerate kinase
MQKKTINDVSVVGKQVIMRVDFNVPLKDGVITDDTRIQAALPTIKLILEQGASLVLMSHLGRPKGEKNPEFSLAPVASYLNNLIAADVKIASDVVGTEVQADVKALKPGEVLLLENTRYYKEEEGKGCTPEEQEKFAAELASYGDIFVNDAFGTAHRSHASTAVITKFAKESVAGLLLEKEIEYLGNAVANPERPFVAIVGGAKVSGKLEVLTALMEKVDTILIGGGMAYTFLKAQGFNIGGSLVENDLLDKATEILAAAKAKGVKFLLPSDNLAADGFANDANTEVVGKDIKDGWMALDIGPETTATYAKEVLSAKTVVWNGPMGCFEMPTFAKGTFGVCQAVADSNSISIIGGGDSVAAVNQSGLADKMSHISTGGGASLEFLEGKALPGVVALNDKESDGCCGNGCCC